MTATDTTTTDVLDPEGEESDELELDSAVQARKLAGTLIIAGCVIAAACIAFIVWEQWNANRIALASMDGEGGSVAPFPNGKVRHPSSDQGPQDGPSGYPVEEESTDAGPTVEG
jgi:uncharacterized membrane protein YebE (DUF533 family)